MRVCFGAGTVFNPIVDIAEWGVVTSKLAGRMVADSVCETRALREIPVSFVFACGASSCTLAEMKSNDSNEDKATSCNTV